MKTCRSCKHWDPLGIFASDIPGIGKCSFAVQYWDATKWNDDGIRALKPQYAGRLAFVSDASDYHAELITLPDFGCVQHEDAALAAKEE